MSGLQSARRRQHFRVAEEMVWHGVLNEEHGGDNEHDDDMMTMGVRREAPWNVHGKQEKLFISIVMVLSRAANSSNN